MTAQEARELSQSVKANIETVLEAIEDAARRGKRRTHYYDQLSVPQQKRLRDLGYKISTVRDRNDVIHTISW